MSVQELPTRIEEATSDEERFVMVPTPQAPVRRHPLAAWGFATVAALLATGFGIAFAGHVHAPAAEVLTATYLATLGIAVVPIAMLWSPLRAGESNAVLVPFVALLSAAAAAVHFAAIDMQGHSYWPFVTAFALLAVFQLAWALLVLAMPSVPVLLIGLLGNLGAVFIWAYSRFVNVPIGPDAGKTESIAFADVLSTILEAGIVLGALALLLRGRRAEAYGRNSILFALLFALVLIPPAALGFISAAGTHLLVPPSN
jgi:hypothetical protein